MTGSVGLGWETLTAIIISFPGLAELTGARVLTELGDDRTRSPTPAP
ncbi:hypothetical protein ACOZ38_29615 [Sphaerisporangium viridialbum]